MRAIAVWVLRIFGGLCLLIPLGWLFSEGVPSWGDVLGIVIIFGPVWVWSPIAFSVARLLREGAGEVAATLLLSLALFVAWSIAWESQMFEPQMSIGNIGIRPQAKWNEGRLGFSILAAIAAGGLGALLAGSWRRVAMGKRRMMAIATVVTLCLLAASVPVLGARERERLDRAREACRHYLEDRGAPPATISGRCADPYDEPFVSTG